MGRFSNICKPLAGAVDEDTFIRSFEDVPNVQIFSARELTEQMKAIQVTIADPNKDWNKRTEAVSYFLIYKRNLMFVFCHIFYP